MRGAIQGVDYGEKGRELNMAEPEPAVPVHVREPVKIKPGELTSEYKQAQESSFWAKFMMVIGLLINVGGVVLQALQQVQASNPQAAENQSFAIVVLIVGAVVAVAGAVQKAVTDASYINGRSLVKAASARDATPPPEV